MAVNNKKKEIHFILYKTKSIHFAEIAKLIVIFFIFKLFSIILNSEYTQMVENVKKIKLLIIKTFKKK